MLLSVARRKKPEVEVIDVALTAKLSSLAAAICTQDHMVTDIKIDGLFSSSFSCLLIGLCWLLVLSSERHYGAKRAIR